MITPFYRGGTGFHKPWVQTQVSDSVGVPSRAAQATAGQGWGVSSAEGGRSPALVSPSSRKLCSCPAVREGFLKEAGPGPAERSLTGSLACASSSWQVLRPGDLR